jgi:undecaprenyl-diphosphatase
MESVSPPPKLDRFARIFPKIDAWDKTLIQRVYHQYEGSKIRPLMRFISMCGDPKLWIFAIAIAAIWGWFAHTWTVVVIFSTGFFQSYVIYYLIKHWIKRPRPFLQFEKIERLDKTGHGYSFPSGHAHHSTLLMGLIWLTFYPKPWLLIVLVGYNLIVGYSRLVSGVHFPSDTVVGIIEAYVMLLIHWVITKSIYIWMTREILIGITNILGIPLPSV